MSGRGACVARCRASRPECAKRRRARASASSRGAGTLPGSACAGERAWWCRHAGRHAAARACAGRQRRGPRDACRRRARRSSSSTTRQRLSRHASRLSPHVAFASTNMMNVIFHSPTGSHSIRRLTMKIENAVALVTGANRGIGLAFTRALLARGARKVYAGARDPSSVTLPGVDADPARRDEARRGRRGRSARPRRDARHQQRRHRPARRLSRRRTARTAARRAAGDQLLRHAAHEPGVRARCSPGQRRRRAAQRAVDRELDQRRRARGVRGQQVGRVVADATRCVTSCAAQKHAGAGAAHGLRRHRSRARASTARRPSPDDIVARALDGLEAGARRSAGRRTHATRQAGAVRRPTPSYLPQPA